MSSCASFRFYLNNWHALCAISSSMWVALHLLGSIWIANITSMKFYPDCEWLCISRALFKLLTCFCETLSSLWVASRALFESLTCFCEILSSLWVAVHLQGSIWITDMPLLNLIQKVSGCAPPGLHLNHWHALMQSYLACEWLCNSGLYFESLIFLLCNLI